MVQLTGGVCVQRTGGKKGQIGMGGINRVEFVSQRNAGQMTAATRLGAQKRKLINLPAWSASLQAFEIQQDKPEM